MLLATYTLKTKYRNLMIFSLFFLIITFLAIKKPPKSLHYQIFNFQFRRLKKKGCYLPTQNLPPKRLEKVAVLPLLTRAVVFSFWPFAPVLCSRAPTCVHKRSNRVRFLFPLSRSSLSLPLVVVGFVLQQKIFCYQDGVESGRGFRSAANVSGTSSVCSGHHRWEQEANSESIDRKRRCSNLRVSQRPNDRFGCAFGCVSVCDGCAWWGGAGVPVPGQEGSYRFPFQE